MCIPKRGFQYINPNAQLDLTAFSLNQSTWAADVIWNVYQGSMNSSSDKHNWTIFDQMNQYRDTWFFGELIKSGHK